MRAYPAEQPRLARTSSRSTAWLAAGALVMAAALTAFTIALASWPERLAEVIIPGVLAVGAILAVLAWCGRTVPAAATASTDRTVYQSAGLMLVAEGAAAPRWGARLCMGATRLYAATEAGSFPTRDPHGHLLDERRRVGQRADTQGRKRRTTCWKAPSNAFQHAFDGRLIPADHWTRATGTSR